VSLTLSCVSYIDRLLQENAKLRALTDTAESQALPAEGDQDLLTPESVVTFAKDTDGHLDQQDGAPEASENPILQPEPWFTQAKASSAPIWIGEASDSAFATRLRQFAAPDPVSEVHVPRTHYATDESLASVTSSSSPYSQDLAALPSPSRSKFLVEVALRHICRCYHIVRRCDVMSSISVVGRGSNGDDSWSRGIECRLWALLAHGELHSTKMAAPGDMFPGLVYFAKASELLQVISERPQLEVVETMLLLVSQVAQFVSNSG
jgi:proline utilization trans-activator